MTEFWGYHSIGTPGVLDDDCRLILERIAQLDQPPVHALTPTEARAQAARALRKSNPPAPDVPAEDIAVGHLRLRIYRPAPGPLPVLVFFHGGGFVLCDIDTHDPLCRIIAAKTNSMVVSADYRLAPEHPYPAAVEDAWAALRWVHDNVPATRLGVCGDSAGGNLAAVTALKARDAGFALAMQILIYPAVDLDGDYPSRQLFAEGYLLTDADVAWFRHHHTGGERILAPEASPLRTEHAGLAPAVVLTAGFDPLRDEGRAYAEALMRAGVPTRHVCFEGTIHGCLGLGAFVAAGRAMLDEVAAAWARA